jgi:multiple sugar transport system permease protein
MHLLLLPLAFLFLFPMIWMFTSALTPTHPYLQSNPPQISVQHLTLENYHRLMQNTVPDLFVPVNQNLRPLRDDLTVSSVTKALFQTGGIPRWFWNSLYLSLTITIAQVLLSCLTGYVFARLAFPGRGIIFALLIGAILLPGQALVIPLFIVISSGIKNTINVDLMNTHWALILPALCSPVGIFLMRQFIQGIPKDLDEAARIDGCGEFGLWWRVILPLSKPILGAWGILTFTAVWRSFFWPFVVLGSNELYTLEVGLQTLQQQQGQDFGLVMAGASVSAIPMIIIFFIFQKQIVRGLTFGAVKG